MNLLIDQPREAILDLSRAYDMVAPNAHAYLWVSNALLPDGLRVMAV